MGETEECHCEAANGKLNIRYDGKVFPCEVFKNNGVEPLSDCEPDNIYEKSIEYIYKNQLNAYVILIRGNHILNILQSILLRME